MKEISLRDLLEAGCHFGHQTTRWNPAMKPYIFMARDRIHIFDLVKTKQGLQEAVEFIKLAVENGGQVLFVGTKRQAQDIVRDTAQKINMPYMTNRWVGGLLTNWDKMKKRLDYLADLKAGKAEGRFNQRTKKENLLIDREINKMEQTFGGITNMDKMPAAIFVADARKDDLALKEAKNVRIKAIAIVDTNANPGLVDIVIPANDDATKSIQLIMDIIASAVEEGRKNKESRIKNGAESKEKLEEKEKLKAKSEKRKTTTKSAKPKVSKKEGAK